MLSSRVVVMMKELEINERCCKEKTWRWEGNPMSAAKELKLPLKLCIFFQSELRKIF